MIGKISLSLLVLCSEIVRKRLLRRLEIGKKVVITRAGRLRQLAHLKGTSTLTTE